MALYKSVYKLKKNYEQKLYKIKLTIAKATISLLEARPGIYIPNYTIFAVISSLYAGDSQIRVQVTLLSSVISSPSCITGLLSYRDEVLEDCPRPRGQLEENKSWPWPWPRGIYLFYSVLCSQSLCGSLELCRARDLCV